MSGIIEYFRNLFHPNNIINRKRRRTEFVRDKIEPAPKYSRVSNLFPKEYTNFLDDEYDFFREVKQRHNAYNEELNNFLMDQSHKQVKAVLDDGEFSDEDDVETYRVSSDTASRPKTTGYNFKRFFDKQEPSTSTAFATRRNYTGQLNGTKLNGNADDDIQFVSASRAPSREMPPLVPIVRAFHQTNGISRESSVKPQPSRGRKSVFDFFGRSRAFNETPKLVQNSILNKRHTSQTKNEYDKLLQELIPRFSSAAFEKQKKEPEQIASIDLSDDSDNVVKATETPKTPREFPRYKNSSSSTRKNDFNFKKPSAYFDLTDDDIDQSHFEREACLSSTVVKPRVSHQNLNNSATAASLPLLSPINSLREKHSLRKSLQDDAIKNIVDKFMHKREEKDRSITEELLIATKLEKERIEHERIQQRRIDESITSALSEKCIIIEEDEDVIDEFPPLNDQQLRFVQYALHGPRNDVIVSKFSMNITRTDLATLDGLNWLNDEIINFYMELIKERSQQVEHLPKVHVMNTFFIGKLLQQGYSGVRRWTRKIDLFSYDIIPIPVHVGGVHWCMSIIHFKNKTIKYYDSMGHPNNIILEALTQYLKEESMDKKKVPFDLSDWSMECVRDCPQQKNGSDCGVFSCQFAEFVSRDSSITFEQEHMPYFRRKMICEIGNGRLFLGY